MEPLGSLKRSLSEVPTDGWPFAILQVTLVDRPATHVRVERTPRGSSLLQVTVGLPDTLTFKPEEDPVLLGQMADQVVKALAKARLPKAVALEATVRCNEWKNSIDSLLDRSPAHE
jgi:hypothetical protein